MIETVQTKDGIDEPEFGYYARMEGYTNLNSDMKELGETSAEQLVMLNYLWAKRSLGR